MLTPRKRVKRKPTARDREVVREHRERLGDVCPGWARAPHHSSDLTADHIIPVSRGGDIDGPVQVLCRSCNSRKGKRLQMPVVPVYEGAYPFPVKE